MNTHLPKPSHRIPVRVLLPAGLILFVGGIFLASLMVLWAIGTKGVPHLGGTLTALFAADSAQAWWYVTRAAGLTAYLLTWLSMVWGLAISSRFFHPVVDGTYSYDFHEFLSLLGLGFVLLHVAVLLFDRYEPFSVLQVLIPFVDSYRPFWVGLGIIGFYILLLVSATFYLKAAIGIRAFRLIHVLSLAGYVGATLHGLYAGTDSALALTRAIYLGTGLVIVFLTVYWLVLGAYSKREKMAASARLAPAIPGFDPGQRFSGHQR